MFSPDGSLRESPKRQPVNSPHRNHQIEFAQKQAQRQYFDKNTPSGPPGNNVFVALLLRLVHLITNMGG